MKKYIALLLALAVAVCLFAGCGSGEKEPQESAETPQDKQPESEEVIDYSGMKIGMLLSSTVTDGGWNQAMAASMKNVQKELGMTEDQIIYVESLPEGSAEAASTIVQLISEGCNLIIGASSGFVSDINAAAPQYPDVYFAQFEGTQSENTCSFSCWDIEAIFLCGYAAALMSNVDQLGYVAPNPQTSVVRGIDAWAAGAKEANPNATVQIAWANSWYDPAVEKECANALLESGVQCLGYNGSSTAVCQAAEEAGGYATGYNIDMHDYAPNAVLTSFVWNWAPQFTEIINEVATDSWDSAPKYANMADGAASLAPWNADIMPADVIAQCEEMYDKIISGEYVVFGGPLTDREGNELLGEGETFTMEELIDCYWLMDNVIGELP